MRVEVRLFATLADYVDRARAAEAFEVEIPDDSSVSDLIAALGLPSDEIHLAVVDGRPVNDRAAPLAAGGRVALFPPVGGG